VAFAAASVVRLTDGALSARQSRRTQGAAPQACWWTRRGAATPRAAGVAAQNAPGFERTTPGTARATGQARLRWRRRAQRRRLNGDDPSRAHVHASGYVSSRLENYCGPRIIKTPFDATTPAGVRPGLNVNDWPATSRPVKAGALGTWNTCAWL